MIGERSFLCFSNVFSPKYFMDSKIFAQNLPDLKGEDFLEIGCGTGAVSIHAAWKGAQRIVSTDINPVAVENTLANIRAYNLTHVIDVRNGDLFAPLHQSEKFDTIFWNTPNGFVETDPATMLERAVFDPQYRYTERFISQAKVWLKPNGRLLIGFSSTLGRLDLLEKFCKQAGIELRLLLQEWSTEIHPVRFELFEAR